MLLHHVVHDDAPSPRRLNSNVPRDLETVCLKCLEKDPRKRYASANELAEELRVAVEGHDFSREGVQVHPTICIGVATWPEQVDDPSALFKAADDALYRAKRAGKNRVESANAASADRSSE